MTEHSAAGLEASIWPPARRLIREYLDTFQGLLEQIDVEAVATVAGHLRGARDLGATIYVAGNGGSAATATHFTNDLGKAAKRSGRAPLRVMCLSDNVSWLTALANDEGYERVFAGQLENFARPGDVLVVISASGNSPNLVAAVALARSRGMTSVGILGFDGGVLSGQVDVCLWLPSEIGLYGPVETCHALLCDLLTTCLMRDAAPDAGGSSA